LMKTLLGRETPGGRSRRLRLQRAVHAFGPSVLLWVAGLDRLGQDPPSAPTRSTASTSAPTCSWRTVRGYRCESAWGAVLLKQPREDPRGRGTDGHRGRPWGAPGGRTIQVAGAEGGVEGPRATRRERRQYEGGIGEARP